MTRLVIADSGPLFSLAAGNLLHILAKFRLGITDIVKQETIDRGLLPGCSIEAARLLDFYNQNVVWIEIYPTQVGVHIDALRKLDPGYPTPPNLGELSIQSLLIQLLINTCAFLMNAEIHGLIPSAKQALSDMAAGNRVPPATLISWKLGRSP